MSRSLVARTSAFVAAMAMVGWLIAVPGQSQPGNPNIGVDASSDAIEIFGFSDTVTVRIFDGPGGTRLARVTADPSSVVGPEDHLVDIEPGMEVVVSDSTAERRLVLEHVQVTVLDVAADVTRGAAPATTTSIGVIAFGGGGDQCNLDVPVTNGMWEADFGAAECMRELTYDTDIELNLDDEDGDRSFAIWELPECDGQPATIFGTPGADLLVGTAGADVIHGLAADDTIRGRGGNDTICGGAGQDMIDGGNGRDTIFGQAGSDTITGGKKADTIEGNRGADVIDGNGGPDTIEGNGGVDTIRGGSKADTITGGAKGDDLAGNAGPDVIDGNGGPDKIRGGPGDDTCDGGKGANDVAGC